VSAIKAGDIVRPKPGAYSSLTSGCCRYDDAIVLDVDPFVLVSRAGDMRWQFTVRVEDFDVIGQATQGEMDNVEHRRDY
jgi:hypothetical protein